MKNKSIIAKAIRYYLFSTSIFIFSLHASAQKQESFIEFVNAPKLTQQQNHYAQTWISLPSTLQFEYCRIQTEFLQQETFEINLLEQNNLTVDKRNSVQRVGKMFSWFGKPQSTSGNINFVVNDTNVTGWIFCPQGTYYIYPIGEGMHIMFNCIEDGSITELDDVSPQPTKELKEAMNQIDLETGMAKMLLGSDCKVRLAICYTDDVAAEYADVRSFVQSCVDITNEILLNSDVSFEVELARSYENSYAEPGDVDIIMENWKNMTDGQLDEISTIRTFYDADLNILLVDETEEGNCGRAATDDIANSTDNFCVLKNQCAIAPDYTFTHEMAHLFGCNHDPYVSEDATPYSFGHGHVNIVDGWRTVMAYTNFCDSLGLTCSRIPHFSNPDVFHEGAATGTTDFFPFTTVSSDNAQVLDNTGDEISAIEVTLSNKTLPSENIFSGETGDVIATTSTTHSGAYTIHSGGSMSFRAGNNVILKTGFLALSGSSFLAAIESCDALRVSTNNETSEISSTAISIYPNPSAGEFTIDLSSFNTKASEIKMRIFDASGKIVWENRITTDELLMQIDISEQPKGIYTLVANTNKEVVTQKLILQ